VGLMPEFSGNSIHFNPNSSYRNMKFWSPDTLRCNRCLAGGKPINIQTSESSTA
jgi:hypothetical protein